ncbi:NUDIX domain-containing protein [Bifidobacterium lemurum]|uniref:NUDIX domain-containing protein n=1 Tax=Bifidobacterium lemurum TaxID=1603886 RepID=A0A261FS48_9BIFI|nr:NUDIX hydrolase [Bifidobacterium lemurum]OZG61773.1 NUDIX domain-containing protein [Bifidobacterium lemurum]QOL34927.1 NUDIX hydrolase [Bifidobacterium lemurum]
MNMTSQQEPAPPLTVTGERVVYQDQGPARFAVTQADAVVNATGERLTLHYASVKDARTGAVCIAVRNGEILLARHWRATTGDFEWEFPRGMGETGEQPETTAARELQEETGILANLDHVRILNIIHADTGVLKDSIAVAEIAVDDLTLDDGSSSDWELTNLTWLSPDEISKLIRRGEIRDGITLAGFALWMAQHEAAD